MDFYNLARWDGTSRQRDATGGPRYNTNVVTVQSGKSYRQANWENSLGAWELGNRGVVEAEYQTLLDFFHVMQGRAYGFRIRDWMDFRDNDRGILGETGLGNEDGSFVYQMFKKRTVGAVTRIQKITRPVGPSFASVPGLGNTIQIFVNGSLQIQDNIAPYTPGSWRVDDSTGVCVYSPIFWQFQQFTADAGFATVETSSANTLVPGDFITLTNLPAPHDVLNGLHEVVSITSSTEFVIATTYVGSFSGQLAGRNVSIAIPPSIAVTWKGQYDYPAMFATDEFTMNRIDHFNEDNDGDTPTQVAIMLGSIPVVQLRE